MAPETGGTDDPRCSQCGGPRDRTRQRWCRTCRRTFARGARARLSAQGAKPGGAQPLPADLGPGWPAEIPCFGPRTDGPLVGCLFCRLGGQEERPTTARYGGFPLCLPHARAGANPSSPERAGWWKGWAMGWRARGRCGGVTVTPARA